MKYFLLLVFAVSIFSCKTKNANVSLVVADEDSLQSFFPVTDYLMGQVEIIKNNPLNPLMIKTAAGIADSMYVKIESLDSLFKPFMHPLIDTANLMDTYKQSRFYDKTIDQYTLSYEAKDENILKEGLLNWDVYVSPKNNMVSRVFMRKKLPNANQLQLTWETDKQCKIIEVDNKIESPIVKETNIIWKF